MKILMVCLGNICRSPIAEGVMRMKLKQHGIRGEVDSAGILSYHVGEHPDRRATETARKYNVDISGQVARQFSKNDLDEFDLILTMDRSVQNEIESMIGNANHEKRVKLFMEYAGLGAGEEVPDPYYGGQSGFENVFGLIDSGCELIIRKILRNQANENRS